MCADFDLQILASLNSGLSYNPDSALTTNFHILVSRERGWLGISQAIKF